MKDKQTIQSTLHQFEKSPLLEGALALFQSLGYGSEVTFSTEDSSFSGIRKLIQDQFAKEISSEKCISEDWKEFQFLFQFSPEDTGNLFKAKENPYKKIDSFFFATLDLKGDKYTRSELAAITREMNKPFQLPVIILFRYGSKKKKQATLAVIDRRISKSKDPVKAQEHVLEKVSLIHNIHLANPHRAHIDILNDLDFQALKNKNVIDSFVNLYEAWQTVLDTKELNKKFYKDISNWYFWALQNISFPFEIPESTKEKKKEYLSIALIRLLTRLIFVWFLKEKKLIPEELFNDKVLADLIKGFSPNGKNTTYYTSILQNLFFATLNTYRNGDDPQDAKMITRRFRSAKRDKNHYSDEYMVPTLYRYESNFKDPNKILELFKDIPFLNGGLFECLDKREPNEPEIRIDCFSDVEKKQPNFPDYLFFSEENKVDLSKEYGDKKLSSETVHGLIRILAKYKFTIEENTPLEEEIALDPELLGKVFENLLASFNPETSTTARKQTGSFYTPREIVNYMVEESLIAYYEQSLQTQSQSPMSVPAHESTKRDALWTLDALRTLLSDASTTNPFNEQDTEKLVKATGELKCLDPACGSGAFPMGVLQKLVSVLKKLDPQNKRWKKEQLERNELEKKEIEKRIDEDIKTVSKLHSEEIKAKALADLEEKKKSIERNFSEHEADYARKLYLIENCIYGVDIQPIAVQITKLRFFISLIVEQKVNPENKNLGIIPLPNLETKFVVANTLIGLSKPESGELISGKDKNLLKLEEKLNAVRKQYFYSRSRKEKNKLKEEDKKIRQEIFQYFTNKNDNFKKDLDKILKLGKLPKEAKEEIFSFIDNPQSESVSELQSLVQRITKANKMDTLLSKKAVDECKRYFPPKSASEIASFDPYNQNAHADWFDPEYMFGIVSPASPVETSSEKTNEKSNQTGFDIVIGNPPYLRVQGIQQTQPQYMDYYKNKFTSAVGSFDLYALFLEKGYSLLDAKGFLSYILPHKFFQAKFGESLRESLTKRKALYKIVRFGSEQVFDEATTYTCLLFLSSNPQDNFQLLEKNKSTIDTDESKLDISTFNTTTLKAPEPSKKEWHFGEDQTFSLIDRLKENSFSLGDITSKIFVGLQTSADKIYVLPIIKEKKSSYICFSKSLEEEIEIEKGIVKPFLMGKDVHRYQKVIPKNVVIFPYEISKKSGKKEANLMSQKSIKDDFPLAWDYLKRNKKELENRENGRMKNENFYAYIYPKNLVEFDSVKIMTPEIANNCELSIDTDGNLYHTTKVYSFVLNDKFSKVIDLKYLLSILNSKLLWYFISNTGYVLRGGYFTFKTEYLKPFPIPKSPIENPELQKPLIALVDKIMQIKSESLPAGGDRKQDACATLESEIDARVFHLYGLTEEEMMTVLDSFPKMTQDEKELIKKYYREIK